MQSKPKANSIVTTTYDADTRTLTFRVRGQPSPILFHLDSVSDECKARAMLHGFAQRIPDSAAIGMQDKDGRIIPAETRDRMKYDEMVKLRDHYESGTPDWSRVREGGERETGGIILRALATVQGIDIATMRERVAAQAEKRGMTERKFLNGVATAPAVVAEIARIRAASGEGLDGDALLGDLT